MGKLKAEITYNHRQKTDIPLATVQTILAEVELSNYEESLQEESSQEVIEIDQDSQDEDDYSNIGDDFGNYLQEWIGMLEDEKKAFEELEEIDDDENDNITHPAINLDAKWELLSIFKELNFLYNNYDIINNKIINIIINSTVQTILAEVELSNYEESLQEESSQEVIEIDQDSQDEDDYSNIGDDFGNYLQEWIGMLEDEKKAFEELEEIDDDENDNITHPAINLDAKWELLSIFKELNFLYNN
ncbi:hypothetical protein Glove_170g14 [Diversispora epigaea]|uniref:Uncharacterized protein n=1 Tax=Diversispora epigaea TaxID=1348612 RepID=A0A397IYA4_9GLOM|nr:hypothetical protein Glove_170g14 [Diversispora epigaea]